MATSHIIAPSHLKKFVFGGAAVFTIVSENSGQRLTFRMKFPKKEIENAKGKMVKVLDREAPIFVSVLSGGNNIYSYIGYVNKSKTEFIHGGTKAKVGKDAMSTKVITKLIDVIAKGGYPTNATIYHEGKCGICGRPLTVPSSILTGIGPVCDNEYDDTGNKAVSRKRKIGYILGVDSETEWHG